MPEIKTSYARVKQCLKIVNKEFEQRRASMENRSSEEQNIIGNFLTSTQIELERSIKDILDICAVECGIDNTHTD